jgi:protein TonB
MHQSHFANIIAFTGACALHMGIAAWAMVPSDPVIITQQQLIQFSMVAPSYISEKKAPEEKPKKPDAKKPVSERGTIKAEKEAEPIKKPEKTEQQDVPEEKPTVVQNETSGIASADAKEKHSALTEPVFSADYLKNPSPIYPTSARRSHVQGRVMLEVRVSKDGLADNVSIAQSSGFSVLDRAAKNAVQRWRFVPARKGSQVVEASVLVPIEFKLN